MPASLRSDSFSSDQDLELSSTVKSLLGISTPEGVYQVPSKIVKFYDENTLERQHRHQEITEQISIGTENTELDSDTPVVSPDGSLRRYHAEGPGTGYQNGVASRSRTGMGLDLSGGTSVLQREHSLGNSSITSFSSQLTSPMSMSDDVYQLVLLWKGVWLGLNQQRKRFESILTVRIIWNVNLSDNAVIQLTFVPSLS